MGVGGCQCSRQKILVTSPLRVRFALRNKAYNNSGSLQEPQKNPTASSQVNIRGAIGVQANIQGFGTEGVDQVGHSWLSSCASYGGSEIGSCL